MPDYLTNNIPRLSASVATPPHLDTRPTQIIWRESLVFLLESKPLSVPSYP